MNQSRAFARTASLLLALALLSAAALAETTPGTPDDHRSPSGPIRRGPPPGREEPARVPLSEDDSKSVVAALKSWGFRSEPAPGNSKKQVWVVTELSCRLDLNETRALCDMGRGRSVATGARGVIDAMRNAGAYMEDGAARGQGTFYRLVCSHTEEGDWSACTIENPKYQWWKP